MTDDKDIILEPEADADMTKDGAEAMRKLKEELKKCRGERDEYLNGWQRAKADFVNARKDEEKARATFVKFANEGLLVEFLPVLESFERAMGNKEVWEKVDANWRLGVEHIATQLSKILADHGFVAVSPDLGTPFDASRDEVVAHEAVADEARNNTIVAVVEKGYALHGKIVKPAKVKVGEYKK